MPSWSFDEVRAVVPYVYPEQMMTISSPDGDKSISMYTYRFNIFGGIARTIFHQRSNEAFELDLTQAIECCDLNLLFKSIYSGKRLRKLRQLFDYNVKWYEEDGITPCFRTAIMDFASAEIADRIVQAKETSDTDKLVQFFKQVAQSPDAGSIQGKLFERYAHRVLMKGGRFLFRYENDENHSPNLVQIPQMRSKGIVNVLDDHVLGDKV